MLLFGGRWGLLEMVFFILNKSRQIHSKDLSGYWKISPHRPLIISPWSSRDLLKKDDMMNFKLKY